MNFLQRHSLLDTHSIGEARSRHALFNGNVLIASTGSEQNFHLRVGSVHLGSARLSVVSTTGHRITITDRKNATLLLPLRGRIATDDGREEVTSAGRVICVPRPGRRQTITSRDYTGVVVQLPAAALSMLGGSTKEPSWRFAGTIPATTGSGASLSRLLSFLVEEYGCAGSGLLRAPSAAEHAFTLVLDVLADALEPAGQAATMAGAPQLRRAEAYVMAHLAEPLRVTDLAVAAGVSVRSIQLAFLQHHGYGPHRFIELRRLEAARRRLLHPFTGDSIASILHDCGVLHLSRFASRYRMLYGELPSMTLRLARLRRS